jgi:hypothetical protein
MDEVVDEINLQLPETKIERVDGHKDREYRFRNRVLVLHFFQPGEMYENLEVPGRMETLRGRHAVHGGYLAIREDGEDREGWNLVLSGRPKACMASGSLWRPTFLTQYDVIRRTSRLPRKLNFLRTI